MVFLYFCCNKNTSIVLGIKIKFVFSSLSFLQHNYQLLIDFFLSFFPLPLSILLFKVNGTECLFLIDQSIKPFLLIYFLLTCSSLLLWLLYSSPTIASPSSWFHCAQSLAESLPHLLVCFFFSLLPSPVTHHVYLHRSCLFYVWKSSKWKYAFQLALVFFLLWGHKCSSGNEQSEG